MNHSRFPEFDPIRARLTLVTTIALFALALTYWYGMRPDMGAVLVFAVPALLMSVLVFLRWAPANLLAGVLALGWFSQGVMQAYVEPSDRVWSLMVALLSVIIVLSVSWVGLKVRKAKRLAKP